MDDIGANQHPDLTADIGQRLAQGMAVLATLGEAAARLAAEEMRNKERREERAEQLRTEQDKARHHRQTADRLAQHAAHRRAAHHDRRLIAQTIDPDWLARADLYDLATAWRTARMREHDFPEAHIAAEHVEQRLRNIYPAPMDIYDHAVADGVPRATAMRAAAQQMSHTTPARAHTGRRSPAVEPGPTVGTSGFEAAVDQEQKRLAADLVPADYAEALERLGVGGHAAAQALREALVAQAADRRHDQPQGSTPDDPTTEATDEPAAGPPLDDVHPDGDMDRDHTGTRTAAQLAAEWYPEGLHHHPGTLPAHVADRRPANTHTHAHAHTASGARNPTRTR